LALDEPKENENTIQVNSIDVLISDAIKPFADANTIDYVSSPYGEGFVVESAGQAYC